MWTNFAIARNDYCDFLKFCNCSLKLDQISDYLTKQFISGESAKLTFQLKWILDADKDCKQRPKLI